MAVRAGIIGVGYMGRVHGRLLRDDKRCELRAVFDNDERRKQEAAKELGCQAAAGEAALLEQVDAVWIAVPNTLHAAVALRALGAGKHVFCEKPFATTLSDARQVRTAAASSRKVFQVGHNRRFAPVYQAVKRFLEADKPTLAHFKMNRGELEKPAWTADRNVTGGYLYETPYHLFDLARWLFGEVADVQVTASQRVYSEADNFSLLLRFTSGLSLTFATCAHASWHFPFERVEVYGRHFTLETQEMERITVTRGLDRPTEACDYHALTMEDRWGYRAIDSNFIAAVLGEVPPAVPAEEGFRTVELVERIYQAANR